MSKPKKKRRLVALVPRLGPPENLRPGGAHRNRRREDRAIVKLELRKFEAD